MGQEAIYEIDHCIQLVKQLESQLEENRNGFSCAVSEVLAKPYASGTDLALEKCRRIRNELSQLRQQEQEQLLSEQ